MADLTSDAAAALRQAWSAELITDDEPLRYEWSARCVMAALNDWLIDEATETEVAVELLREHPGDCDLTAARTAVRDVLGVVWRLLDKEVGVL